MQCRHESLQLLLQGTAKSVTGKVGAPSSIALVMLAMLLAGMGVVRQKFNRQPKAKWFAPSEEEVLK